MKKLYSCIIAAVLSLTMIHAQISKSGGVHTWSFSITPTTTRKAIDSVVADWKLHGIDLRIYKPLYDSKGVLQTYSGSVAYFSGKSHLGAKFSNNKNKTVTIVVTDKPSVAVNGK